jgi:hypothetical protein
MASPYPVGDFHLLFFASFSWRTPKWVIRHRPPVAEPEGKSAVARTLT